MRAVDLIEKLQILYSEGKITEDTEIFVASEPDKDYDRTSRIALRVLMRDKQIILTDEDSDIWNFCKKL